MQSVNKEIKKEFLIQQIDKLLKEMRETYALDEKLKNNFILPENYLEVQEQKEKIIKFDECNKDDLRRLNYYYREVLAIKESINSGKRMTYMEFVEWKIVDILTNKDEEHPIQTAIHYLRENIVKDDGKVYTIDEAAEKVELIRSTKGIKKR